MFSSVLSSIFRLWRTWTELFTGIPFGNPYIAIGIPLLIVIFICWYIYIRIQRHKVKQELGDQYDRAELYKRITNVS